MSARQKGSRIRLKVKKWFEAQGYLVDIVEKTSRFAKNKDLFGEFGDGGFDLIAIGEGSLVLIQVKTNRPDQPDYYIDFAKKYCNDVVECLVATWYDRDGLRLQYYEPEGYVTDFKIDSKEINSKI